MFSLLLRCAPDREEELIAELWEAGTSGIVEEPGALRAFFNDGATPDAALTRFAGYSPSLRIEPDIDWEQTSRDSFPALPVGERFFLAPPWSEDPTPPGRLRLVVEPGMACGTGWHPCTQMCLEAMETLVKPGASILDVGCGSGILSLAARLLGASRIVACDIDPEAIRIAGLALDAPMFTGSADAVKSAWADVVVANIGSPEVESLAAHLHRIRKPGGALILSGFPDSDLPALPFTAHRRYQRDGWECLVC